MNIGILGCGSIARTLAHTMKRMEGEDIHLLAFASRSLEKARKYADDFQVERAYGSYEELVKDKDIDLVYIATPHAIHLDNMRLALENGKACLTEKAFTANARQAEEAIELAKKKKLLLAEAIWTRYMPVRRMIDKILDSGRIGRIRFLTADLGYKINDKYRLVEPSLAAGSLLDVGVYPVNFALMHIRSRIERIDASCTYHESGVDRSDSIAFLYEDGTVASLTCTMEANTPRLCTITGEKGFLEVENVNNPEEVRIYDQDRNLVETCHPEKQISGYEYELRECRDALRKGETECPSMPLKDTLAVMRILDEIRAKMHVVFPFEK